MELMLLSTALSCSRGTGGVVVGGEQILRQFSGQTSFMNRTLAVAPGRPTTADRTSKDHTVRTGPILFQGLHFKESPYF
jgi:hypothetical protein